MLPQLRQAQRLRPGLRPLTSLNKRACTFTWWHKKQDWLSPQDLAYQTYLRKRSMSTRAELKRALRRQEKWDRITPDVKGEMRHASSSRKGARRPFEEDDDDHESYQSLRDARKQKLERMRQRYGTKSEDDVGQFEPFWNRLMPDFLKQEMTWQTPVEAEQRPATDNKTSSASSKPRGKSFASSRSFEMRSSHKLGSKPTVEASTTSWDSRSNNVRRASYDPISGRMVEEGSEPAAAYSDQQSAFSKDHIDALTASNIRASMGRIKKADMKDLAARAEELATLEEDYKNKTFDNEHDELVEARKTLEALRTQVQILERRAHSSTLTKPEDELDAERPAFFEDGWNEAPQGMQIAFETEKEDCSHGDKKSLEQEMNALNSVHVEPINDGYEPLPTGLQTNFEKEQFDSEHGGRSLEEEVRDLGTEDPRAGYEDGYSTAPSGMQTAYEQEDSGTLEKELGTTQPREVYDDGYSNVPVGMQTHYKKEDVSELEKELGKKLQREVYEDGYSTAPSGMQTLYEKEDASELEKELNESLRRKEAEVDDGYSTAPVGMQTIWEKEDVGTLERELGTKLQREVYEDGYPTAPSGMQTMYEQEDATVLEKELQEKLKREDYDDGYSTTPIGMQTHYVKEHVGALEKELGTTQPREVYDNNGYSNVPVGMQTHYEKEDDSVLEQELGTTQPREVYDDGYPTIPKGMQSLFEQEQKQAEDGSGKTLEQEMQEKHQAKTYDDGYSNVPIGLQTAFNAEQQDSTTGKRETLEQEMSSKMELPSFDGGYATSPSGLQVLFQQEQMDAENNKRKSLEDELKAVRNEKATSQLNTEIQTQKTSMQEHEDGYTRTPIGMQTSFRNEEQMNAIQPGEGDLSTTVGKFCNSRRWYKQSASKNLSEDYQKAKQRALDRVLVRDVRDAYENCYGPITTDHIQPEPTPGAEATVDETIHKALDEHDQSSGDKAYEFKSDNLEQELNGTQGATSTVSPQKGAPPQSSDIKWAEPAIYKVIAYDINKEAISITTTPSNFSTSESPISISSALSRLHQPARFIPYFAELQKAGYQVIHASRDWLILRKVDRSAIVNKPDDADMDDLVNPIDPRMSRRIPYEEPPTGRFASPTGFVTYDPIFPPEPPKSPEGEDATVEIPVRGGPDAERYRHRRTRREEPVFSGSKRWRERRRDGVERKETGRGRFKERMAWALSVGVTAAAALYAFGVAGELAKAL